jgi:hypothetical protein
MVDLCDIQSWFRKRETDIFGYRGVAQEYTMRRKDAVSKKSKAARRPKNAVEERIQIMRRDKEKIIRDLGLLVFEQIEKAHFNMNSSCGLDSCIVKDYVRTKVDGLTSLQKLEEEMKSVSRDIEEFLWKYRERLEKIRTRVLCGESFDFIEEVKQLEEELRNAQ